MTRLRHNIFANFGGQAWSALVGILLLPVIVRLLGIEAFGLVGFFLGLQALFAVFDLGLSATSSRELARHRHAGDDPALQRDLVRSLEWLYWPMGALIAGGVLLASGALASDWLQPGSLGTGRTAHAIAVLGLAAGLQWPGGFYAGGLRGLERQVALNAINAAFATLRHAGAVAALLLVAPTLEVFVWWQVIVSALQTTVLALALWRALPAGAPARLRPQRLRQLGSFAAGMAGIGILAFALAYADRMILSTLLPLGDFGYYTLAATVAAALSTVVQPFFAALYPRFSGLVATGQQAQLVGLYHQSNQLLAPIVTATAAVLALFAEDVLRLWTQDAVIAARSGPVLAVLACGTALNGLVNLPYALQLAHGWTRLTLVQNAVAVALVLPATWWLGSHYGGIGAAWVWLGLNAGFVLVGVPLMHRRLLRGELAHWFLRDLLPPALVAGAVAGVFRLALPTVPDGLAGVAVLGAVGLVTLACAGLASPAARTQVARLLPGAPA